MSRALVLVSGGIDSAVSLWWVKQRGWAPFALTVNYYERPLREQEATRVLCDRAGVRLIELSMPFLKGVGDLQGEELQNEALREAPVIYIPARNLIFYSLAGHFAETLGIPRIVGGHIGSDAEHFPDASRDFFHGLNRLFQRGIRTFGNASIEILLPLLDLKKEEVLRLGLELQVPLEATWSCYWDRPEPCGRCPACLQRKGAFERIGRLDPLTGKDGATR